MIENSGVKNFLHKPLSLNDGPGSTDFNNWFDQDRTALSLELPSLRSPFKLARVLLLNLVVTVVSAFLLGSVAMILGLISGARAVAKFLLSARHFFAVNFDTK